MMERLLLGLMLLMTAGAANADWTVAEVNDAFTLYVDKTTSRRNGNFVKMWNLYDFKKAQGSGRISSLSGRTQEEYDCKEEQSRILGQTNFSGQMLSGNVNHYDSNTGKWEAVAPGSVAEVLWKIACEK